MLPIANNTRIDSTAISLGCFDLSMVSPPTLYFMDHGIGIAKAIIGKHKTKIEITRAIPHRPPNK